LAIIKLKRPDFEMGKRPNQDQNISQKFWNSENAICFVEILPELAKKIIFSL
jgi:hypothetical protein